MAGLYLYKARCEFCGHEPVKLREATIEEAYKLGASEYATETYYTGKCRACQMPSLVPSEKAMIA